MAINQTVDCGMSAFSVRCEIESVPALGVSIGSGRPRRRRRFSSSAVSGYLLQANVRQLPSPYNFFHVSKPASSTAENDDDDEEDGAEDLHAGTIGDRESAPFLTGVHFCHGFDSNH
jgi:hypothetical protein